MGHMAWAPEGQKAGPKGRQPEVGAQYSIFNFHLTKKNRKLEETSGNEEEDVPEGDQQPQRLEHHLVIHVVERRRLQEK